MEKRDEETYNPKIPSGTIELEAKKIKLQVETSGNSIEAINIQLADLNKKLISVTDMQARSTIQATINELEQKKINLKFVVDQEAFKIKNGGILPSDFSLVEQLAKAKQFLVVIVGQRQVDHGLLAAQAFFQEGAARVRKRQRAVKFAVFDEKRGQQVQVFQGRLSNPHARPLLPKDMTTAAAVT